MAVAQKANKYERFAFKARRRGADGLTLPTERELAEGAAYLALMQSPGNEAAIDGHRNAWNALAEAQGRGFGCWRCRSCCVLVSARRRGQPCGGCGARLIGWDEPTGGLPGGE